MGIELAVMSVDGSAAILAVPKAFQRDFWLVVQLDRLLEHWLVVMMVDSMVDK